MCKKARQYKPSTIRRLDTLSGNRCYAPNCNKKLIAEDGKTIVSKICHIEAASKNGPRYNPKMTDDERRAFENLILLCDEHHSIIDNPENEKDYPVSLLQEWKKLHESITLENKLIENPNLLAQAINIIANIDLDENFEQSENTQAFEIDTKISYNNIQKNRYLIEEYKVYYGKIDTLYDELEKSGSFKKDKLLRIIRTYYLEIKGKYIDNSENELLSIQENSDNIIDDIREKLFTHIDNTNEDTIIAIPIIMTDAFMRCKILEKPTNAS